MAITRNTCNSNDENDEKSIEGGGTETIASPPSSPPMRSSDTSPGLGLGPLAPYIPGCLSYADDAPEATGLAMDAFGRGAIAMSFMFLGPALLQLARNAAGCGNVDDDTADAQQTANGGDQNNNDGGGESCEGRVYGMKPSSLLSNMAVVSGVLGGVLMPPLGAVVDHTSHRRSLGAISAALLTGINGLQAFLNQRTWSAVAVLQVFAGVIYLAHNNAQYAYTSELSDDVSRLSGYTSSFNVVAYVAMLLFLVVVMALSHSFQTGDVGTAMISQIVACLCGTVFFGYSWRYLFRERPPLSHVPEGSSLWTCGFRKMIHTASRIRSDDFRALKWFYISVTCSEAATAAFPSIATTFLSQFLQMDANEIGLVFLIVLLAGIPGSKAGAIVSRRCGNNPIRSAQVCLVLFITGTGAAAATLTGPERRGYARVFGAMWGCCLGWLHPTHTTILCTIMPPGQESELMGVYLFSSQVLSWLPPLIFSVLNENGVNMSLGLVSLDAFLLLGFCLLMLMGSHGEAMDRAKRESQMIDMARRDHVDDFARAALVADTRGYHGLTEVGTLV